MRSSQLGPERTLEKEVHGVLSALSLSVRCLASMFFFWGGEGGSGLGLKAESFIAETNKLEESVLRRNYIMQMLTERSILEEIQSDSALHAATTRPSRPTLWKSTLRPKVADDHASCIQGLLLGARQLLCKYAALLQVAGTDGPWQPIPALLCTWPC